MNSSPTPVGSPSRDAAAVTRAGLVLVALGAVALACSRAATVVDPTGSALGANPIVRLDAGAAIVVSAAAWCAVQRRRRDEPAARRSATVRDLATVWALWAAAVVIAAVLVHRVSAGDAIATAVTFRAHGGALVGLAPGRVMLAVFGAVALSPIVVAHERRRSTIGVLIGVLAVAGWASRLAEGRLDPGFARGVVSLGAFVDHVALGVAIAVLVGSSRERAARVRSIVVACGLVGAGLVVSAIGVDPLGRTGVGSFDHGLLRALGATFVAAGLLLVVACAWEAFTSANRLVQVLAVAAPGLLVVYEPAFMMVLRHYPERVRVDADGVWPAANVGAPLVWGAVIAAAFGVLFTWAAVARRTERRAMATAPLTVAAVVALGYLVRLVTLFNVAPERIDGGDPRFYHLTANLLSHARGFYEPLNWLNDETIRPSALHGPLYPLLLSISSRFGGTTYVDHRLASLLIGAGVVLVVMMLAREIAGPYVALVAGLLACVYPNLWILDGILFPEPLAALLTTLAVLLAYRWRRAPSYRATVALAGVIALGALARGEGVLLLALVVAPCVLLWRPFSVMDRFKHLALAGATFVLVISPWTIRNVRVFENFVPLSTNSNELLIYANCDTAYFGPYVGHWDYECQERARAERGGEFPGDESQTSVAWRGVAIDYARAHAAELPRVVSVRVLRQWELYGARQNIGFGATEGRNRAAAWVALAMYYVMMVLSGVALVVLRRAGRWILPLLAPFLGVTFVAMYAYGNTRFRAPAEPALCVLAAIGLRVAWRRVRSAGATRQPGPNADEQGRSVVTPAGPVR